MTTTVTVKALHGWPVRVTQVSVVPQGQSTTSEGRRDVVIVPQGEERDFYVHSHMDLEIHEIQPDEEDAG